MSEDGTIDGSRVFGTDECPNPLDGKASTRKGKVVGISGRKAMVRGADAASENVTIHATTSLAGDLLPPHVGLNLSRAMPTRSDLIATSFADYLQGSFIGL